MVALLVLLSLSAVAHTSAGVTKQVVDLYPHKNTNFVDTLKANGNWADGKLVNALIVFHLDHCIFCEMTLGTMMYNFAHEDMFTMTDTQPYQVLVDGEGGRVKGHSYCADDDNCIKQSLEILGINITAIKGFPTEYYYSATGSVVKEAGDTKCGIAVRAYANPRCDSNPANQTFCKWASNDMDNWVCNLHKGGSPATDCSDPDSTEWQRCKGAASREEMLVV